MRTIAGIILTALLGGVALVAFWPGPKPVGRAVLAPNAVSAPATYRTRARLEPDTCVAAWILTRVVSPGAKVVVGENVPGAVAFDVPGVPLSRRPGKCVSRVVCEQFGISSSFALALTDVAQELELTPWSMNTDLFFERVRGGLGEAVNASASEQVCLERALAFIDQLYAEQAPSHGVAQAQGLSHTRTSQP